ncbi:LOW QUALITY PROTEIN: poly(ADP-ribose) glycohydrolase-like [Oppia nitens]|uniref:LOW QUALITY PROTEIN: poly(ADP-ribose) glycohydrolase-like n=1 Tax=Oppia nitens TaxID=1686743 RepID=UPI0023DA2D52|nr:LOW QUALITY PROTEIN: poly(ADP-ribose) glycohydrolase-like [Oppia nitens]
MTTSVENLEVLQALNQMPDCLPPMTEQVVAIDERYVLYRPDLDCDNTVLPKPYPDQYVDHWDENHVKMPNSPENIVITDGKLAQTDQTYWMVITESLSAEIKSAEQFERAIKAYNPDIGDKKFDVFETFVTNICNDRERDELFNEIIPQMSRLALSLPKIVTQSIPLLRQRQNRTLFLSQQQCACLLANSFLCTFPQRNQCKGPNQNLPVTNFLSLFTNHGQRGADSTTKLQKLKCIVNYFRRVIRNMPTGVVSFERRYLQYNDLPDWSESEKTIRKLVPMTEGLIETEGSGFMQIDFANKNIGGGVLSRGCVQEEIRFVINPELLVARLFTERQLGTEAVHIYGTEQFNTYSGYSKTFKWTGDYVDQTPSDQGRRRATRIIAIDALHFSHGNKHVQYGREKFERELNKAFAGFLDRDTNEPEYLSAIASGNWGCGAYNGDPELKTLIQLMASSQVNRDLVYFTFNNPKLKTRLDNINKFIVDTNINVGQLHRALIAYADYRSQVYYIILYCKTSNAT